MNTNNVVISAALTGSGHINAKGGQGNRPITPEAIAADVVFSEGLMALKQHGFDSPQGALLEAIQSEKDSVLFYSELAAKAADDNARRIFDEIIRQEKGHMRLLQMRLANIESEG